MLLEQILYSKTPDGVIRKLTIAIGYPKKNNVIDNTWQCSLEIFMDNGYHIYKGPSIMNISPFWALKSVFEMTDRMLNYYIKDGNRLYFSQEGALNGNSGDDMSSLFEGGSSPKETQQSV